MKKKVLLYSLLLVSLAMIMSGCSLDFFIGYKQDKMDTLVLQDSIDMEYREICDLLRSLRSKSVLMQDFFDLYYEEIDEHQEYYYQIYQEIEEGSLQVSTLYQNFMEICKNVKDDTVQEKYKNVQENYKNFEVTYQSLKQTYQDFMEKYEQWESERVLAFNR